MTEDAAPTVKSGTHDAAALTIRECVTREDFDACVWLQREAFGLPDIEISPRRHLIVSRWAGGWTLAAFAGNKLDAPMVGFVHHLVAVRMDPAKREEIIGYSHMMAVAKSWQNHGVGAQLKWAQRARALAEGRRFIKWTWEPMQARNAHFNLNRLGVAVRAYAENFYGTDYLPQAGYGVKNETDDSGQLNLDSDRLFAEWELDNDRVRALAGAVKDSSGETRQRADALLSKPAREIIIPPNWSALVKANPMQARTELLRVRAAFQAAFAEGLVCRALQRDEQEPRYLLYAE